MYEAIEYALAAEELNKSWPLALVHPIPNSLGTLSVDRLRPLVLQKKIAHKWFVIVISLQLENFVAAITRRNKKHPLSTRKLLIICRRPSLPWTRCKKAFSALLTLKKAFDSVTHTYAVTFFRMMHISSAYVTILLQLFQAPIAPILHGGI